MFVSNIKTEFYDVVFGNRVLLLAACDMDALCACKILQYLFKCDNILYTLIPVHGQTSLIEAYAKYKSQARFVILINCGAAVDIIECLQPNENVVFFIFDSHRPVNIHNAYSESQIRLLMKSDDCEGIPAYDDVFLDEDSEDEEDESGRPTEASLMARRRRRIWEENREKTLFDYYQTTYYGEPTAFLVFDLAWKMSRDNNDLLWLAILGLAEQYVMKKIEQEKYVLCAASMQSHLSRHNRAESGCLNSVSCMKISFEKDLNLGLYRHWSMYESMANSQHIVCKFKLWSFKGQRKFLQYLVQIGLPLAQCKQKFAYMGREYRNTVCNRMEEIAEEYGLDQIVYGAFISQFGFGRKLSAIDVVRAINAILESTDKEKTPADKFLDALDALNRSEYNALQNGIELAKVRMIAIMQQVQQFIDMKRVINAGPFLYSIVTDITRDVRHFSHPECLSMLAHFLLEAHVSNSKNRRVNGLPLILFALDDIDPEQCLIVGIPPLSQQSPKNFLGKAFEQAAKRQKIQISQDLFCPTFAHINKNDQGKFLESLYFLLN